jgi:hypothetical protein
MNSTRLLAIGAFAAITLSFSVPTRAQDQSTGDPVADAARKARDQKKEAPKPKKVFTEDDIAPRPAEQATPSASVADASTPSGEVKADGTKPPATKEENPNSEQAWRKRFTEQHRKISDAEQELDVLQREASKADLQYYSDPQKAMKEQFSRDEINKKNADIDAKKKQIADLKQQLNDMEDQLRASGGDAGWSR